MAKATKSATAPAPAGGTVPAQAVPPAAAPADKGLKDKFVRKFADGKPVPATKKIAPQAQIIVNLIEAAGSEGITRADLIAKLPAAGLVTRQPVGRILSYYQKLIQEIGCVEFVKTPEPAA